MPQDPNFVSTMGQAVNPQFDPNEYARQQQAMLMGQALLKQGLTESPQGQMVSGRFVAPSWTQQAAKLANILMGNKLATGANSYMMNMNIANQRALMAAANGGNWTLYNQPQDQQQGQQPQQNWSAVPGSSWNLSGGNSALSGGGGYPLLQSALVGAAYGDPAQKAFLARNYPAPTDLQKNDTYMGISPADRANATRAEMLKNSTTPLREGNLVRQNPDGTVTTVYEQPKPIEGLNAVHDDQGRVIGMVPVPGAAESNAAYKGAQEAAVESNKIIPVQTGSGATVPMFAGRAAGGGAPAMPSNAAPGINVPSNGNPIYNFPGMTRDEVMRLGMQIKDPTERAKFLSGLNQAEIIDQTSNAWNTIPKMSMAGGIGQTTFNASIQKAQGEQTAKLYEKYGNLADEAQKRMALNNQALSLVDQADTGPHATQIADVKNWLVSRFHIPENHFNNSPSATIALQKDLVNAATQKAKQHFGSRITQSEVNLMLTRGSPSADMTKAALRYLLQSDNAQAAYQIQQGNDLGKYINNGGDPFQFEAWYSRSFPMTNALEQVHLPTDKAVNKVRDISPVKTYLNGVKSQSDLQNRVQALRKQGWTDDEIRKAYSGGQ